MMAEVTGGTRARSRFRAPAPCWQGGAMTTSVRTQAGYRDGLTAATRGAARGVGIRVGRRQLYWGRDGPFAGGDGNLGALSSWASPRWMPAWGSGCERRGPESTAWHTRWDDGPDQIRCRRMYELGNANVWTGRAGASRGGRAYTCVRDEKKASGLEALRCNSTLPEARSVP